jgi:hypothetical protein
MASAITAGAAASIIIDQKGSSRSCIGIARHLDRRAAAGNSNLKRPRYTARSIFLTARKCFLDFLKRQQVVAHVGQCVQAHIVWKANELTLVRVAAGRPMLAACVLGVLTPCQ